MLVVEEDKELPLILVVEQLEMVVLEVEQVVQLELLDQVILLL